MKTILASASPRRRQLLGLITGAFEVITLSTDESVPADLPPEEMARELALRKASAVAAQHPGNAVIGADTIVVVDGRVLGKPEDEADAARMLRLLAGRRHAVYTGVAVLAPGGGTVFCEKTAVEFISLTDEQIAGYIATGEPMDKAGAYGIQDKGALFISRIDGDYYNVMGLPVCRLAQELAALKVL